MIKLYNTSSWNEKKLKPYLGNILIALKKLEGKIPQLSAKLLWSDIKSGKKELWIIKNNNEFVAIVLTETRQNHKGQKSLIVHDYSGTGLNFISEILSKLQQWLKKNNIKYIEIAGRKGWEKILKEEGFKIKEQIYIKETNNEL